MQQISKSRKETRNSNLELLRILMMLSLIAHHFIVNSGIPSLFNYETPSSTMLFSQIFGMWGKTAINVFTLITGYFMVKKQMTYKKIAALILEACFYVYIFYVIFLFTGYEPFSLKALIQTILFIPFEAGWYYTGSMIVMMLFVPFANILINALSKRQYQILLGLLLTYFTIFSSFLRSNTFNFIFWLLTVYLIGAYIRLFQPKWDTMKTGAVVMCLSILLMVLSIIVIDKAGVKFGFTEWSYFFSNSNKILAVTASVGIFTFYKNLKLPYNKLINTLASTTFGVLLIHANSWSMRRFLWVDLFKNAAHYPAANYVIYASIVVCVVYICCCIIDLLRINLLEKPLFSWLDKFDWIHKELWK